MINRFKLKRLSNFRNYNQETQPKLNFSSMTLHTGTVASLFLSLIGFVYQRNESLRKEVKEDINSVRQEVKEDINSVRQEVGSVRQEVNSVRQEVNSVRQEVNSVRQEVNLFRQEMSGRFDAVNGRLDTLINAKK
jgi:uncharacterized protein (DUF3084 family)